MHSIELMAFGEGLFPLRGLRWVIKGEGKERLLTGVLQMVMIKQRDRQMTLHPFETHR